MHINIPRQAYGKYGMLSGKVDMSKDPAYAAELIKAGLAKAVTAKPKKKAKLDKDG